MAANTENRDLLLREVRAIALVANSPTFLLRRLQENAHVVELARNSSEEDLVDAVSTAAIEAPTSSEAPFAALASLAALGLKDVSRVALKLGQLDLSSVPWGNHIRKLLVGQIPASNSVQEFNLYSIRGFDSGEVLGATSGFLEVSVQTPKAKKGKS